MPSRCSRTISDRNLLDFNDVTIDKFGRVLAAFTDGCITTGCINGGTNDYTAAQVIARDPANWWCTLQIDRGSRDGLTINLAVLSAEGHLVGRLSEVNATRSQVLLLGDPKCRVGAIVVDAKNQIDQGVVLGRLARLHQGARASRCRRR